MSRRPPALAVWLLDRLGYTRHNAALAGDLLEEFRNGRSAGWYWRQTFAVIANGLHRHLAALAPYVLAVTAGYAVQFSLSYALWSLGFPPGVARSRWAKIALWSLMQIAGVLAATAPVKWRLGRWHARLRPMFRAAGSDRQKRATILALACYESFSFGFWSYCLCAVVLRRFSQAEFFEYQTIWFVLWVLAPAVLPALAVPATHGSKPDDSEPWLAIPQCEPVLTVALPDGRAVPLERDRLAESIFAAASPELIRVAFGSGKSLDVLRRAIWLGGHRSRSYIQGREEIFTLAELGALIEETVHAKSVIEAWHAPDQREGFWQRVRLLFCGDSA